MTIFVGIVTYNSSADLPACLSSLRDQVGLRLAISILDNASSDNTPDWIEQHAADCVLFRSKTNLGYGRGHNRILASLPLKPGDYYLSLNPDAILTSTYVTNLVSALQKQQAAWGTGKLLLRDSGRQGEALLYSAGHALLRNGYAYNIGFAQRDNSAFNQSREVFGAPGAAALFSYNLIKTVSDNGALFDPDFFMYGEDVDVDWRAQHHGFRCWYEASAVASHRGSTPGEEYRVHALGNRYLSVIKNAHPLTLLIVNLPYIILHVTARLIISPRYGWRLFIHLARLSPRMVRKRSATMLSLRTMNKWFQWGRRQPSNQPRRFLERLRHFTGIS